MATTIDPNFVLTVIQKSESVTESLRTLVREVIRLEGQVRELEMNLAELSELKSKEV